MPRAPIDTGDGRKQPSTKSGSKAAPKSPTDVSGYNPFTLGGIIPQATSSASKTIKSAAKPAKSSGAGAGDARGSGNFQMQGQVAAPSIPNALTNNAVDQPQITGPFDGLTPPNLSAILAQAGGSTKSLSSYIADAVKGLGSGTNYGALQNQLKSDTKNSDTKIGQMYAALNSGIRANDPVLKQIYNDSSNQIKAAGSQSQGAINSAYNSARAQTAAAAHAAGATVSAVDNAAGAADQGNAIARSAASQQGAVTQQSALEANARTSNMQTADASNFAGAETRSEVQQNLADSLAKLQVQQSTENSSRRAQALQAALQMQSGDRSFAQGQAGIEMQAAQNGYQNQLGLVNANLGYQSSVASAQQAALAQQENFATQLAKYGYAQDPTTGAIGQSSITNQKQKQALLTQYLALRAQLGGGTAKQVLQSQGYNVSGLPS